jgi:hypothetical protein
MIPATRNGTAANASQTKRRRWRRVNGLSLTNQSYGAGVSAPSLRVNAALRDVGEVLPRGRGRCVASRDARRNRWRRRVMGRVLVSRTRRLWVYTCVAAGLSVGFPSPAVADLYLVFDRPAARPGDHIEAVYADNTGRPYTVPPIHGVRVYFVPMTRAKSGLHQRPTGLPHDPLWVPLGRLRHEASGMIRLHITIPDVQPGDYTIGFWCRKCAPPQGANFTSAYPGTRWRNASFLKVLRIYRNPTPAVVSPSGTSRAGEVVATAVALTAGCLLLWLCRRRTADGSS